MKPGLRYLAPTLLAASVPAFAHIATESPARSGIRVPQPTALAAALRRSGLTREDSHTPMAHGRFPLSFPVDRGFGTYLANGTRLRVAVTGHGPSSSDFRSVSFQFLFWNFTHFDEDVVAAGRALERAGVPAAAAAAATAMIRDLRGRLEAQWEARTRSDNGVPPLPFLDPVFDETRLAGGLHIRAESSFHRNENSGGGLVTLQFTNADAPQVAWPAPREIESLQPDSRWPSYWGPGMDVMAVSAPELFGLECRPAGRDAYRCDYVLTISDWIGRGRPRERYSDLFRRGPDGSWTMVARGR